MTGAGIMKARCLATGFGPFDRFGENPSSMVASVLSDEFEDVVSVELPVIYGKAREGLLSNLERIRPETVISFGLNGRIGHIALEEIAVNIRSSEKPDNSGKVMTNEPISPDGELAYRTTLPVERILDALRERGIPAGRSYSAGVYICNEVFYTLMEWCAASGSRGGFVHVPMVSEMIAADPASCSMPHMSSGMLIDAGRTIVSIVMGERALR
ncbi:MAG: pyroglutamyl-peptidase I [Thermoplasmata archaeon]|nr:MAG: pyroglutamyl-peptidase I [Thermoplasmata archaeon]